MNDIVAEIFGYGILLVAAVLFGWEMMARRRNTGEDAWLQTPARFKRRMVMAVLLSCVGLLIVAEARNVLVLEQLSHLMIFVTTLLILAIALFTLSIRDLGDMARNAEKYALKDLEKAIREQQEKQTASRDNP